ncbi:MAG: helix-turn-helix domain-containing protein [Balneolaceae bacterium]|nr:helix-turn-helix domain-containing protein [Balneolaceae bacterium]MCH8549913.1 AraC family transcriptional regulator [Balneolaceae bacterium]
MKKVFENHDIGAFFAISTGFPKDLISNGRYMMFIWNDGEHPVSLCVDERNVELKPDQISCLTYLHRVESDGSENGLKLLLFNREFYCVHTYDSEVSCNGLLFFGSNSSPILQLDSSEPERLNTLFGVLNEEFTINDSNQEEMLRILLKRFIIRCTRMAREQILKREGSEADIDLIRTFNVLVEEHFRTKKTVSEYAELMYKSPKTVTNVFGKYSDKSPLQVIHDRVIMEAKRLLYYTDKSSKEIGFELGYTDPAQFSRFFKTHTGTTTTEFKKNRSVLPA